MPFSTSDCPPPPPAARLTHFRYSCWPLRAGKGPGDLGASNMTMIISFFGDISRSADILAAQGDMTDTCCAYHRMPGNALFLACWPGIAAYQHGLFCTGEDAHDASMRMHASAMEERQNTSCDRQVRLILHGITRQSLWFTLNNISCWLPGPTRFITGYRE